MEMSEENQEQTAATAQEEAERRKNFDELPGVFFTIKATLNDDGSFGVGYQFDGPALKARNTSQQRAAVAYTMGQVIAKQVRNTLLAASVMEVLGLTNGEDNDDGNKGERSGDGSNEQRADAATVSGNE
jgi:hypothetical protein